MLENLIDAVIMTLLIAAAMYFFVKVIRVKFKVLLKAKPEVRWDRVPDRIETVLRYAFGQKKMFKENPAGIMHAFIFWGFLVLLVRSMSLMGRAYDGGVWEGTWALFWFWPSLDHLYSWLKDWTEIVVLLMVVYAFFRRLVLRPERLTFSGSALMILGFIGGLMITDFLYDAGRFAANVNPEVMIESAHSPIGSMVAGWLAGLPVGALKGISVVCFWTHIVILLLFLNELPRSKHFHVITAIPNVFFSKLEARGAIKPILDIEEQESFGVNSAAELTWKQIVDGYTCTECGRCTVNCPAFQSGKPLSPKKLINDVRDHVKRHEDELLGNKEPEDGAPTLIDDVGEEVVWSCTTCRSCEENCPVMINHVDKIVDMRRYLMLMEGKANPEVNTAMKNFENKSNPWGLASGERGEWCKELGVPLISEKEGGAEYLLFLGCFAAYDDRNQKVAKAVIKLLQKAGVDFAILGAEEQCCGDPSRRLGNEYLFQIQAQTNIETFNSYGVKKVLTACPHCFNALKNEYPQFDGDYEVIHHTTFLMQLIKDGKLDVPAGEVEERVTFHDSCYLGRYNDIYDAPRDILRTLGIEPREIERSRVNGMCCGAGGGLMFREEGEGERMNQARLKQLKEVDPDMVASACPFCLVMLRDGVNELGWEDEVKTKDVAELLAERLAL
ncbi:MAG: (Fe-S)-binding protein [Deltaproteobacteria bacterium]|nr:(Fe-S)-binding protein [Deltaproteobacteria bacterium]